MNRQLYLESEPFELYTEFDDEQESATGQCSCNSGSREFEGGFYNGEFEGGWWQDFITKAKEAITKPADTAQTDSFGTLTATVPGRKPFSYKFTSEDALWTARFLVGEAGGRDNKGNQAVIWAMFNRYALFTHPYYDTFHKFIRAYSTPLQPVLKSSGAAKRHMNKPEFVKTGGTYEGTDIPRGQLSRFLKLQKTPWEKLPAAARSLATRALKGQVENPIGNATEFASTRVYFHDRHKRLPKDFEEWRSFTENFATGKKWKWVGPVSGLDQMDNAFFIQKRVENLTPGTVRVVNGVSSPDQEFSWLASIFKSLPKPSNTTAATSTSTTQNQSAPRLLETENQPAQSTLYVEIKLKNVHRTTGKPVTPMTGIFIPEGFSPQPSVDVIIYLHGFDLTGCNKAIKKYWDGVCQPHFPLRVGVNDSGKNVILVAPTLGSKSESGDLIKSGALDTYLDQVMGALKAYGPYANRSQTPQVGNIILACHSGGGYPMRQIALAKNRYGSQIRECWGFDCTYNTGDDVLWAKWARENPQSKVYIYSIKTSGHGTWARAEKLKSMKVPNVFVERTTKSHNYVPITYWKTRIQGASFLKDR